GGDPGTRGLHAPGPGVPYLCSLGQAFSLEARSCLEASICFWVSASAPVEAFSASAHDGSLAFSVWASCTACCATLASPSSALVYSSSALSRVTQVDLRSGTRASAAFFFFWSLEAIPVWYCWTRTSYRLATPWRRVSAASASACRRRRTASIWR